MTDDKARIQAALDELNVQGWQLVDSEPQEGEAADAWVGMVESTLHRKLIQRHAKLIAKLASTAKPVPPADR